MKDTVNHNPQELLLKWNLELPCVLAYPLDADHDVGIKCVAFAIVKGHDIRERIMVQKLPVDLQQFFIRYKGDVYFARLSAFQCDDLGDPAFYPP
jgi:hypothetical protein